MAELSSLLRTVRKNAAALLRHGAAVPAVSFAVLCNDTMPTRIAIALVSAGLIFSQVIAGAERCAQRLERQQLERHALLISIEQEAQ